MNVTGTINNAGQRQSFTLNNATGSWTLKGGSLSGGTLGFADSKTLVIAANGSNLLSGVTVNGDLTLNTTSAVTKIAGGTTFTTAHLAGNATSLGFAPGQTLSGTILFEGAVAGTRHAEMNGTAGTFTIGATGVIRTNAGLTGDGGIGDSQNFGGAMTLINQGLISSQVSGRTITIATASLANSATGILEATGGGILTINSTNWTNAGTISVNAATVNLGGTFTRHRRHFRANLEQHRRNGERHRHDQQCRQHFHAEQRHRLLDAQWRIDQRRHARLRRQQDTGHRRQRRQPVERG